MTSNDMADIRRRMDGALSALKREFAGLRTGRASTALLEPLVADAYGAKMPISQLGNIGVPEPRLLTVQVWDNANVKAVAAKLEKDQLDLAAWVQSSCPSGWGVADYLADARGG